ncbi:polyhydroxyalkanoic acid system family protein [uncultured Methylobacterium sp.]|uniref:polyhydroxyalkanoic acid system family protein n=1 Tax=uncultured Methylobacterium sp. TaxID=157278 RepID=UPI0035C9D325
MAKPLIVDIPHDLGRDEARRRIATGVDQGRALLAKSGITINTLAWTGDRLDFAISAMTQGMNGQIDVGPESVRVEVHLPLLLALFAEKVKKMVGKEGNLLLTKK